MRILFLVFIMTSLCSRLMAQLTSQSGQFHIDRAPKTTPKKMFGHNFGDDDWLANYSQLVQYWKQVEKESDRIKVLKIGVTTEGRDMWMAVISAPENLARVEYYRQISQELATADKVSDSVAQLLSKEGKAIVWIDGGLHSNEVLTGQVIGKLVQHLTTANDEETKRIRRDVISLVLITNPDGMENYNNRVMSGNSRGFLWLKYGGHDNNRDFYMAALKESQIIDSILYRSWFPQIVVNHHQRGDIMSIRPFHVQRDNYTDPLVLTGGGLITNFMLSRFIKEGKRGVGMTMEDDWWNGYLSGSPGYHNMIGIITETDGAPRRLNKNGQNGFISAIRQTEGAIFPEEPSFRRDSCPFSFFMDYVMTANLAVLDAASQLKESFLLNIYRMGRNAIESGSKDHWTIKKSDRKYIDSMATMLRKNRRPFNQQDAALILFTPEKRDARAYIISRNQPDFLTATKFVNILIKNGITVYRAKNAFKYNEVQYLQGSYIVFTAQAFRPHVLNMFEPQEDPPSNGMQDPGGYTLAYQMGVKFTRVQDKLEGPFELIKGFAPLTSDFKVQSKSPVAFSWSCTQNDAFTVAQLLLSAHQHVSRLDNGDFYIKANRGVQKSLRELAVETGVQFKSLNAEPKGKKELKIPRIALMESGAGNSSSASWYRYVLDQFRIPYTELGPYHLESPELRSRFDVIVAFSDMRFLTKDTVFRASDTGRRGFQGREMYVVPALKSFVNAGGNLIIGGKDNAIDFLNYFQIPADCLKDDGKTLRTSGSIFTMRLNKQHPLTRGMDSTLDMMLFESVNFQLKPDAVEKGVSTIAYFDTHNPLKSGKAIGAEKLFGSAPVIEARYGKGFITFFGANPNFRSQSQAAFKLFFNCFYR